MTGIPSNTWWGPPKNFSDRKNERKISWLELFYDLVYVAAISQLTHHLAAHPSWHTMTCSFLIFSLLFWSWVNGSQYYDLHGNDGIRTRVFTLLQMMAVAAVAITISDVFELHHRAFAITFAVIEFLIGYLWWSVGWYDHSHRAFNKYYIFNYSVALILLVVSVFTSYHAAIILWCVVLLFNLTPSLTGARAIVNGLKKRGEVFSASETLVERFGLFTIIVLAESILGTVSGIAAIKDKDLFTWISFIVGIFISFLLWSLYFDMTSEQQTKKGYAYLQWLIFLHFPLLASLSVVGACIKVLLTDMAANIHSDVQWMFCIAIAIILFMIVGIASIMQEQEEDRSFIKPVSRLLNATGVIILIIPFFGRYLDTIPFLSIVAAVLFIPVYVGVRSWVLYKYFSKRV